MSPSFDDLVGTDLERGERERLERVHELLIAAGPPPEPAARVVELRSPRRRGVWVAIAAAIAVALIAVGAATVTRSSDGRIVTMSGTPAAPAASGSLRVLDLDAAGNWPLEVSVEGLEPASNGKPFELWLTRDGKLEALCGSFRTATTGDANVPMNAPYRFSDFDGWVVVEEGSETPLLTT